jgi:hypothetical protein
MSSRAAAFIAATIGLAVLVAPRVGEAQAGQRELVLTAGPTWVTVPDFRGDRFGPALGVAAFYGLSNSWSIGAHATGAWTFTRTDDAGNRRDAGPLVGVFAGPAFNVDIVRVVPWVSLMPGVWAHGRRIAETATPALAIRAAVGADWRLNRRWSVGGFVAWEAFASDPLDYPALTSLGIRVSRIFETDAL